MVSFLPTVYFIYAALLILGGAMGTIVSKNHEPYSIIGSLFFGAIVITGGLLIRKGPQPTRGIMIGIVGAALVTAFFAFDFAKSPTHKMMPAVPAIGMSVLVLVIALIALSAVRPRSEVGRNDYAASLTWSVRRSVATTFPRLVSRQLWGRRLVWDGSGRI